MRIALLCYEFPGCRPGGIGSYVLKCAVALAAVGHEAHIFTLTLPPDVRANLPSGVHLHEVSELAEEVLSGQLSGPLGAAILNGGIGLYKLALGWRLCDALRETHAKTPFDIVEAAEYEALALPLALRPIQNLPLIVQIHLGSAVNRWANETTPSNEDQLVDALEAAAIMTADALCAATQSVANMTRRFVPFEQPVTILPHAIIPHRATTPAPKNGPVLFLGRLQKRKGCQILALAASQFLAACPTARLQVVGSDTPTANGNTSMQQWMLQHIAPNLHTRVEFKGELPPDQVRTAIEQCRFQVVPSLVENFANTAGEAMAADRAVVYAGGTGTDELVGDAGFRVFPVNPENLASTIIDLYRDDMLLADLADRGHRRLEECFSVEKTVTDRINFYAAVIKAHRPPRPWSESLRLLPSHYAAIITESLIRLTGNCADSPSAMPSTGASPGRRTLAALTAAAATLHRPVNAWLFGAGRHTTRLLAEKYLWESLGHSIAGIIDDHPRFTVAPTHLGLPVLSRAASLDRLDRKALSIDAVILSTDTFESQFLEITAPFRTRGISTIQLSTVKL